jgi:hypothetical protein
LLQKPHWEKRQRTERINIFEGGNVKLSSISEDQELRSNVITNAEVLRPYKLPNDHMPYPREFVGIQNISPLVKDQSLLKAPKPHDIRDINSDPRDMLK